MGCDGMGMIRFRRHEAHGQSGLFAVDPPERCPGCPKCKPWDFEEPEHDETAQEAWERARLDEEDA